jgi:hypothetical protein
MATTNGGNRLNSDCDPQLDGHSVPSVVEGDGEEAIRMAKISVEMRCGTARFAVAVQAPTIQQALNIAATRYPGNVVRVKSPTYREGSYVEVSAA